MPEQENALVTTGPAGVPSPVYVLPGLSLPVQVVEFLTSLIADCNRRISLQLATLGSSLGRDGSKVPALSVCPLLLTIRSGRALKFGVVPRISLPPHLPIMRAFAVLTLLLVLRSSAEPQTPEQPDVRIYKTIGTTTLKAYIFVPGGPINATPRAAIVLLHGGGWSTGSPEWMYDDAKRYTGLGMVAIAGEYRLSDQKSVTPLDAMADVRDLIRWVRTKAAALSVDPHRIVAYGVSAGGHLAVSAAVFPHTEEGRVRVPGGGAC